MSDPSSILSPSRLEAIQRIKDVYPQGKPKCPWCGVRGGKHNFDCPTPDVWYLLTELSSAERQLSAQAQELERVKIELAAIQKVKPCC